MLSVLVDTSPQAVDRRIVNRTTPIARTGSVVPFFSIFNPAEVGFSRYTHLSLCLSDVAGWVEVPPAAWLVAPWKGEKRVWAFLTCGLDSGAALTKPQVGKARKSIAGSVSVSRSVELLTRDSSASACLYAMCTQ